MPKKFTVIPDGFPQDLASSQLLPENWEEVRWTFRTVYIRHPNGSVVGFQIDDLVRWYSGDDAQFAGLNFVNHINGRQIFFGLNPESTEGNMFSGSLYHERAGGGSNIVFAAQKPDGNWIVGLLDQERPTQDQSRQTILQIPGGYPIQMAGSPDQIHRATSVSEGKHEVMGTKYKISADGLINLYAPHNTNNGTVVTGRDQGIATQLLVIPFEALSLQKDGTYKLLRDRAEVSDAKLERIFGVRFHDLTPALIKKLHQPENGYAACAKTVIAIDRVYFYLVLGI